MPWRLAAGAVRIHGDARRRAGSPHIDGHASLAISQVFLPQVARTSMGTHAAVAWEWRRVTKIGAPAVKRSPHAQAVDRGQAPPSRPCLDYRSAASRTAVNLDRRRRAETAIDELRAAGVPVVAVETVAGAPYAHEFAFPPPPAGCALLLGNERRGAGVGPGRLFPEESPERLFKLSRRLAAPRPTRLLTPIDWPGDGPRLPDMTRD